MLNTAYCLVEWLGLDLVSGWLAVMHTFLYYIPQSLYHVPNKLLGMQVMRQKFHIFCGGA